MAVWEGDKKISQNRVKHEHQRLFGKQINPKSPSYIRKVNVKKEKLNRLEKTLIALQGVNQNSLSGGYLGLLNRHYRCSIVIYQLFLEAMKADTKFSIHYANNFHEVATKPYSGERLYRLKDPCLFKTVAKLADKLTTSDENGRMCGPHDLASQNRVVEGIWNECHHRGLLELPTVDGHLLNLKSLENSVKLSVVKAATDYLNSVVEALQAVYFKYQDTINRQKFLSVRQAQDQWDYLKKLFRQHDRLHLIRGLVALKVQNNDYVQSNQIMLETVRDFFKTHKNMSPYPYVKGFLWRLEPTDGHNVYLQYALFCDHVAMEMDPFAVRLAIVDHWSHCINGRPADTTEPHNLKKDIQVTTGHLGAQRNYRLQFIEPYPLSAFKKINDSALMERPLKKPASPVQLFGELALKFNPLTSKSLKTFSDYFVLIEDFFTLGYVQDQKVQRTDSVNDMGMQRPSTYKRTHRTRGRGQFHAKKKRKSKKKP